jgi:hypothetical protein
LLILIVPVLKGLDSPDGANRVTTTVEAPTDTPVRVTEFAEIVPTVPDPLVKTTVRDPTGPDSDQLSVWID